MILYPTLPWKNTIFELIKTSNWAEQKLEGETETLKWVSGQWVMGMKARGSEQTGRSTSSGSVLPESGHLKL